MYESLLNEACKERIEVVYKPFKGRLKGLYCDKLIAINKNIGTTAEKTCILAEELGHYYTSAGDILDQGKIQNRKMERRARTWAYDRLVPLDKLIQAFNEGIQTRYEMAEYLGVPECFLNAAIKYYKERYGTYRKVGDYYVCFDPFVIIHNFQKE